ncbi:hypothetical protein N9D31_03775, partial [Oligoflexaceae bacterium]|nr:hypothetical protein [Oligoflexaceae bacterium]
GAQFEEWAEDDEIKNVMAEVHKFLRPEFINRLDEVIVFNRLEKSELKQILRLQLEDLGQRLAKISCEFEISQDAEDALLKKIDTNRFGARPLKRAIEQHIENAIATLLISSDEQGCSKLKVEHKDGEFVLTKN